VRSFFFFVSFILAPADDVGRTYGLRKINATLRPDVGAPFSPPIRLDHEIGRGKSAPTLLHLIFKDCQPAREQGRLKVRPKVTRAGAKMTVQLSSGSTDLFTIQLLNVSAVTG
jgi:hypothetical protein